MPKEGRFPLETSTKGVNCQRKDVDLKTIEDDFVAGSMKGIAYEMVRDTLSTSLAQVHIRQGEEMEARFGA